MQKSHAPRISHVVLAATLLGLAACSDEAGDIPTEVGTQSISASASGIRLQAAPLENAAALSVAEREAAEAIARSLALALRDAEVRQELKAALATSAVREHKLHFASFMQGRGGNILAAMQRHGGLDARSFRAAVAKVRDMEFYMPVEAHRNAWTGGSDVLVGVMLIEDPNPVAAFTTSGEHRALSVEAPPAEPVLMLVPVETDFQQQAVLNERGSSAVDCTVPVAATLTAAAERCQSSGAAPRTSVNANAAKPNMLLASNSSLTGLYATYIRVSDYEEYWTMGSPELELHAFGKKSSADGSARMLQCSGEHAATTLSCPLIQSTPRIPVKST